jgi:hypothetical protein
LTVLLNRDSGLECGERALVQAAGVGEGGPARRGAVAVQPARRGVQHHLGGVDVASS